MKNFTYRSLDEKENIEEILKRRRRKVNRQQIVSILIFLAILGSVALYVGLDFFESLSESSDLSFLADFSISLTRA